MFNPILKTEWLKEGRSIWLPMMIIFYNAILAFITILFMFFNAESFQEGYSYDTASYLYQFLIISSFQIATVFVIMPFCVWGFFALDREKHMIEQYSAIPGFPRQFILAKIFLVLSVNILLFTSSLPIITLSCIYSGLSWRKVIRLGIMMLIFIFWSGSISIFSFSVCKKGIWAFAGSTLIESTFGLGTLLMTELMKNASAVVYGSDKMAPFLSGLCWFFMLLNPFSSYMGYYGNITGDTGLVNTFCGHIGIDTSSRTFSLLFYKSACIMCILTGILFLTLAIWKMEKEQKEVF